MATRTDNPEARAWLTVNDNPSALAANKLQTTARALALVYDLYTPGAPDCDTGGTCHERVDSLDLWWD
jgi:hypothetical protein